MHPVITEKIEDEEAHKKQMKRKTNKRRDHEAETEHIQTEGVLCSEDWRDIVITYIPDLNNISIKDNYVEITQDEIKKAYKQYRRTTQKKKKVK